MYPVQKFSLKFHIDCKILIYKISEGQIGIKFNFKY